MNAVSATVIQTGVTQLAGRPRFQIYRAIHKGIRGLMMDTLARVGRMDVEDPAEMGQALGQTDALLEFCLGHVRHENEFIHPALEARQADSSLHTADDHVEHLEAIARLQAQVAALWCASAAARAGLANELYAALGVFIAENFEHMNIEETHNQSVLEACYTDGELMAIHDALLATVPPQEKAFSMRWMLPHLNPTERMQVFLGMRASAPREAYEAMLGLAREVLSERDWFKLQRALQA
jgi:hypothetical protein